MLLFPPRQVLGARTLDPQLVFFVSATSTALATCLSSHLQYFSARFLEVPTSAAYQHTTEDVVRWRPSALTAEQIALTNTSPGLNGRSVEERGGAARAAGVG